MAGKVNGSRTDRTSTPKSEATRARVLTAAARVLAREGYAGTRLTDVAREAEVHAPAIYYYFDSREELLEEVAQTAATNLVARVSDALEPHGKAESTLDRIDAAAEAHLLFTLEAPDFARALFRNVEQFSREGTPPHQTTLRRYHRLWTALLREAGEAGLIRDDVDEASVRHYLIGMLNSTLEWWVPGGRTTATRAVDQGRLLVRRALRTA